jgi:cytochrome c biogenesis protein CcdA
MSPLALIMPVGLGVVGAFTPCALGINALFLAYLAGKSRATRLAQAGVITGVRATFLMTLGLLFGLFGQTVATFIRGYQPVIALVIVAVGVAFILNAFVDLPMPRLRLFRGGHSTGGAAALGAAFGLSIPACTSPLVIGLLAQTVLVGDWATGAVTLFLFGVGMSLPLVAVSAVDGVNRGLVEWSRRWRTPAYVAAGGLFIVLGAAEFSPRVMMLFDGILGWVAPLVMAL